VRARRVLAWSCGLGFATLGAVAGWVAVRGPDRVREEAAARGVRIDVLAWCRVGGRPGLCATGLTAGPASIARATLDLERRVVLDGVVVRVPEMQSSPAKSGAVNDPTEEAPPDIAGDPGAPDEPSDAATMAGGADGGPQRVEEDPAAALARARSLHAEAVRWLRGVEVRDLRVEGGPVDVPVLRGTLLPELRLDGERFHLDAEGVAVTLPTRFGTFAVQASPAARDLARWDLVVTCEDARIEHPDLAEGPLSLPPVRVVATAHGTQGRLAAEGSADVGAVKGTFTVTGTPEAWSLVADIPGTPVAELYRLVGPLVPEARRANLAGTFAAVVRWEGPAGTPVVVPNLTGLRARGLVGPEYAAGTFTWLARDARGEPVPAMTGDGMPGWVGLREAGPWLPAAILAAEDGAFRGHPGYSIEGMMAAAADNAEAQRLRRGGSTLTQQLAKNLFLDGRKTYARKLRELLYAVDLEGSLGKDRILELYLNIVEWGPEIRGAKAAAWTYFAKQPAGLSPEEAAWLASILPYPRWAHRTQYLEGRVRMDRVTTILQRMRGVDEARRDAAIGKTVRLVPP
jgi:hypothetical protein